VKNVYYSPEEFGLQMVGEVDFSDQYYVFSIIAVFRDPATGQLYYGEDSGCSCPSPFEDFRDREDLTATTPHEIAAILTDASSYLLDEERTKGVDLAGRIMAARWTS